MVQSLNLMEERIPSSVVEVLVAMHTICVYGLSTGSAGYSATPEYRQMSGKESFG